MPKKSATTPNTAAKNAAAAAKPAVLVKSGDERNEKIKELVKLAQEQGYLTYDDINDALPDSVMTAEELDAILILLRGMDIEIIEASGSTGSNRRRRSRKRRNPPSGSTSSMTRSACI